MGRALAGDVATFRERDRRLSVVSMPSLGSRPVANENSHIWTLTQYVPVGLGSLVSRSRVSGVSRLGLTSAEIAASCTLQPGCTVPRSLQRALRLLSGERIDQRSSGARRLTGEQRVECAQAGAVDARRRAPCWVYACELGGDVTHRLRRSSPG